MKRALPALICLLLSILLFACGSKNPNSALGETESGDTEETTSENTNNSKSRLEYLREKYPEYFGLDDFKGLEVYVCSFSADSYSCVVLPGTNRNKTVEEIMVQSPVTTYDMQLILDTYDTPDNEVFVLVWHNPLSSYTYVIDSDYIESVSEEFGGKYTVFEEIFEE